MRRLSLAAALAALAVPSSAGTVIWDGRFNDLSSSADLEDWSWSNQVGPYQYYIHGPGGVAEYVNLSPAYKNPADASSAQGARLTLDGTAYWEGQNMRRTELIPQAAAPAAIVSGRVWYHFSMMAASANFPSAYREHQIGFFESHFTEMKTGADAGAAGADASLRWYVGGVSRWSANLTAGVWHNIAYEIDFGAGTVGFWHSTGADDLVEVVSPISASTSSNGADWHVGVLELPRDGYADADEDLYFSGVYIESGSITKSVSGPGGSTGGSSSSSAPASSTTTTTRASSSTLSTSTVPTTSSTTSSGAPSSTCTASLYGQCGGIGYTGCTVCAAGSTCKYSNDYYSQCL